MNKPELRKFLLKKRNSLSRAEVLAASESIIKDIENLIKKSGSMIILGFMPIGNEIDLTPLFKQVFEGYYKKNFNVEITFGLPVVCGREIKFIKVKSFKDLKKSSFGIMEPDKDGEEITAKNAHVLVPLIGLNKNNKRLGFGGGFYDRYFNIHRDNILYGIAYDFQTGLDFEGNEHDISMDIVFISKNC